MMLTLFRVLGLLPLGVLQGVGAFLGHVVYAVSPSYRRRINENLPAGLPERRRVLRRVIGESGKQMLEVAWVWMRPGADILARVRFEDEAGYAALMAQDRAILMLTPHLGCFEAIAQAHALGPYGRSRPMLALYRIPRKAALLPLVQGARARHGLKLAPADLGGVRLMLRALRDREVVGLLPDQVPSRGEGVWAPFFGRPAFTMTLPGRLARAHDALVLLLVAVRLPRGAGFRVCWEALDAPVTGEPVRDATALNAAMERLILRHPEQYLWSYNRYKVPAGVPAPGEART